MREGERGPRGFLTKAPIDFATPLNTSTANGSLATCKLVSRPGLWDSSGPKGATMDVAVSPRRRSAALMMLRMLTGTLNAAAAATWRGIRTSSQGQKKLRGGGDTARAKKMTASHSGKTHKTAILRQHSIIREWLVIVSRPVQQPHNIQPLVAR